MKTWTYLNNEQLNWIIPMKKHDTIVSLDFLRKKRKNDFLVHFIFSLHRPKMMLTKTRLMKRIFKWYFLIIHSGLFHHQKITIKSINSADRWTYTYFVSSFSYLSDRNRRWNNDDKKKLFTSMLQMWNMSICFQSRFNEMTCESL